MKFHFDDLKKFDVLVCESFVVLKHYIIYLSPNLFIHNTPIGGVVYIKNTDVLKRNIIKVIRPALTVKQKAAAQKRINQVLGFYYDAIDFNCEHFMNFVIFGKRKSKQVIETFTSIATLLIATKMITDG